MTGIVGLFVCPLLCLYSSGDAWLCCAVWPNILGVAVYLNLSMCWDCLSYI